MSVLRILSCRNSSFCRQNQLSVLSCAVNLRGTRENEQRRNAHSRHDGMRNLRVLLTAAGGIGGVVAGYAIFSYLDDRHAKRVSEKSEEPQLKASANTIRDCHRTARQDLPTYRMSDVQKHNTIETGVWVTYGIGVYDITKFIPLHPGSKNIMLGAGAAIDPFWHIYQQHNTEEILKLLETFRIGNLNPEDDVGTDDLGSPWANEPKRHPLLKPAATRPFNAEPPITILTDSFTTPSEFFYIRNHLPVPNIDAEEYELEVEVESTENKKVLKLDDIKKLPKYTFNATIMCGGNRRSEMNKVKEVKGLNWGAGAIGNAEWSGARLRDVLQQLGVESDDNKHVILEGYDLDPTGHSYAASIPLPKAMDERGDVLLAYEMNGEPLTRDHGYPVRVVVPGVVGVRNVKWLSRIVVSDHESDSHWQQMDYKGFSPSTDWDTVDFSKSPAIQNMPVTSAICSPISGDKVKSENGFITVKGYAWSGGGNKIIRVDLTADGGASWHVAELEQEPAPPGRHWAWTLWTAEIPVSSDKKEIEIWAKAVDSNYNCQPESFKNIWNLRGLLSNAYNRVKVNLI